MILDGKAICPVHGEMLHQGYYSDGNSVHLWSVQKIEDTPVRVDLRGGRYVGTVNCKICGMRLEATFSKY